MSGVHDEARLYRRLKPFCFGFSISIAGWFKGTVYLTLFALSLMAAKYFVLASIVLALTFICGLQLAATCFYRRWAARIGLPLAHLLMGEIQQ